MGRDELLSAVFGLGPLVVRGLRTSDRVTVAVTTDVFQQLAATDGWDVHSTSDGRRVLRCGSFEAVDGIELPEYRRTSKALIAASESVDGVPVVRLTELLASLQAHPDHDDATDVDLTRRALRDEILQRHLQRRRREMDERPRQQIDPPRPATDETQENVDEPARQVEPPLWAPHYGCSYDIAVRRFFRKYATFSGRPAVASTGGPRSRSPWRTPWESRWRH